MSAISNFLNQIKTAIYGEQVRDAIHDSILQCYTDVTNAKTLADQSTTSANNAAASANTAATKANNAATSANNAAQSATTAANTANAAANNADNAKAAANSAASVATSAANQANDAASAANTAKTNADTATKAANTAAGAANTAAEAANTAATKANTAKDNAVAATEAVNAAAETINDKGPGVVENASGAIASFSDGSDNLPVKNLVVNIEPVQDLHGYDSPWPAGGGKNLWGDSIMANDMARTVGASVDTTNKTVSIANIGNENNMTDGVVFKEATQYTFILNGAVAINSNLMFVYTDGTNDRDLKRFLKVGANVSAPGKTVSGLYKRNYSGTTVINYETSGLFEGDLTADQFSPYSNICPIEGWTGVKATRAGKNLLVKPFRVASFSGVTFADCFPIKAGTYRMHYNVENATTWRLAIRMYDKDGNYLSNGRYAPILNNIPGTISYYSTNNVWMQGANSTLLNAKIVFPADCYVLFFIVSGDTTSSTAVSNAQLELGSTATDYEPCFGETLDISIPSEAGTVYGGSLNVATGELVIDRGFVEYTSKNILDIGQASTGNKYILFTKPALFKQNDIRLLSNQYLPSVGPSADMRIRATTSIIVYDNRFTDLETAKTLIGNLQVVCYLNTPLTYHLTPTQVKTFLGQNNIFADAGDVNVDYIADTKLYIDNKFTELQALVLENVGG